MTELKRCPFCGGEAAVFDYWNEGKKKSRWVVMCKNCKGGLGELDTKEEAIEKWNNRWMIPCEEGETEGNWHTGTPTEEGWYLICSPSWDMFPSKYNVAEFDGKDFVYSEGMHQIVVRTNPTTVAWQKITPFVEAST